MKIAHLVVEGENIKRIAHILSNHRDEYNVDNPYVYSSGDITVIMREGFYFRISSTLVSVIILKFMNDNKVEIELVVSGGKNGVLMHSWGAEDSENRSIVHELMNTCVSNGWQITNIEPEDLKESYTKSLVNKFKKKMLNPFKK